MRIYLASLLLAAVVASPCAYAGETLDRIVATVNGHIILQSDWDDAVQFQALENGIDAGAITPADRKASLDRLIDQELLREQMPSADSLGTPSATAERVAQIRKLYPSASSEEGWQSILKAHGLTPQGLEQRASLEVALNGLVDARLRPSVSIDSASIESYYNQELLPQLQRAGADAVPLATVTPRIKELLTQEKVSELLVAWLQNLRAGSDIRSGDLSTDSSDQVQ